MDTLAPARISASRIRKKPNQPWFSQALKILQRKYRQKERGWKLSLGEAERVDLKLALNTYKKACQVAKSDYFTGLGGEQHGCRVIARLPAPPTWDPEAAAVGAALAAGQDRERRRIAGVPKDSFAEERVAAETEAAVFK
ncbi:hypothetical protein NDU88_005772 [Pleurodeles waltl]|uniref:Uncharacterized protein n=1 Tax=Pleurodeles waltl TaxID=8319 RepID=A0AAV7RLZ0_PLEWA|nr:hypothetical protein NDU88_005772 [Pleurodeles waltl]